MFAPRGSEERAASGPKYISTSLFSWNLTKPQTDADTDTQVHVQGMQHVDKAVQRSTHTNTQSTLLFKSPLPLFRIWLALPAMQCAVQYSNRNGPSLEIRALSQFAGHAHRGHLHTRTRAWQQQVSGMDGVCVCVCVPSTSHSLTHSHTHTLTQTHKHSLLRSSKL